MGFVACELAGAFEDKCWSNNIVTDEVMIFVSLEAILSSAPLYCVVCIVKHAFPRPLPNVYRALYRAMRYGNSDQVITRGLIEHTSVITFAVIHIA